MPVEPAVFLLPTADDAAIDGVVAGIDVVNLVDGEVGLHGNVLEADVGSSDAGNILIEPGEQVAEQHDMVARVHLRRRGVTVPQFPDGGGAMVGHIAPRRVLLVSSQEPGQVGASHVG